MLRRIAVAELALGMFVHSLECSWLDSPFWRTRFLLDDPADLALLKGSSVAEVVIDEARGRTRAVAAPIMETEAVVEAELPAAIVVERRVRMRVPRPDELEQARRTVEKSKVAVTAMFAEARLGRAVRVSDVAPLVEEIAESMARDRSAMLNVTRLKTKNEYTYLHSVAVCALMMNLARHLGMGEEQVHSAGIAGLLHDIGKMAMPGGVLDKPDPLDDDERRIMRSHPSQGHELLRRSADVNAIALDVCLHHHERIDGRGYPFGLTGDQLSIYARMGAICDVYDAVTSVRPYKRPWSPNEALARMLEWEGHFDRKLLETFIASIGIAPLRSVVRLHSRRLALVIGCEEGAPSSPRVRAFYDIPQARFIPYQDVATDNAAGGDPIVRTERGERWFRERWREIEELVGSGVAIPAIGLPSMDAPRRPAFASIDPARPAVTSEAGA
ncbi:HD-GYP domain-containing protein [Sphingomonas sp.]|uniref:HD-GYP domain-containing protein n=1 Tax=Sphingomonas sp. TaxID=28214 RepID=UPI002DD6A34B|nr:HD-GYP domain-containing protein [Sphingomonas sp.]